VLAKTGNPFGMRSYEKCACKPFRIRSYNFIGLKALWNEQMQKKVGGGAVLG